MRRHDGPHGARIGGHEERGADALDKRDHGDQPERIRVQGDDDDEDADSDDAHGVRADHQPLPVPAVGHDPAGSAKSACGMVRAKSTKPAMAAEP